MHRPPAENVFAVQCRKVCGLSMSVPELFGIIKLSFRQAEGRRVNVAVLCLKYIASVCVAGAMTGLFLLSERTGVRAALMAACAAGLLLAVSMRGVLLREMYLLSERYLRSGEENRIPRPALTALADRKHPASGYT